MAFPSPSNSRSIARSVGTFSLYHISRSYTTRPKKDPKPIHGQQTIASDKTKNTKKQARFGLVK